ncbi:MAG TPA: hypothetical protein VJN64_05065, partial [Terriglobales bacterium]|nr:hypothetical protein [Terriglobales bacterium]
MNGLAGARVVLLDDEANEVLPVIKALSRAGIPVVYFDGKSDGLPLKRKKLRGVRLAILDMNLGQTGSDENIASTLVQTFSRIIARDNGPYGILIWTNHPELRELTARYIFEHKDLPNPVFIVHFEKAAFLRIANDKVSTKFSVSKFSKELLTELNNNSPLECIQVWEGSSFRAATNVTNALADLTVTDAANLTEWRQSWREEVLKLLFTLGRAHAEEHLSVDTVLNAIFLALNPLHSDRLDALVEGISKEVESYALGIMGAQGGSAIDRKAKVNTMLHLAFDHLDRFSPGNLYVIPKSGKIKFMPPFNDVVQDCAQGKQQQQAQNLGTITSNGRMIALEITPVCDFAQNKMGLSRIMSGFILPHQQSTIVKNAQFLKMAGPFL